MALKLKSISLVTYALLKCSTLFVPLYESRLSSARILRNIRIVGEKR